MKLILIQGVDVAKDLINTTDATIIGILLAVVVVLLTAIWILWKKIQKDEDYIRTQDRANLEMLAAMTKNAELLGLDINHIKDYTIDMKPEIKTIAEIIKTRLNKQ